MIAALPNHIRLAEDGRAWIDDTNVKVIEVVLSYFAAEGVVDRLVENHPDLTPARVHAAMAWYHDHREAFDREIALDDARVNRLAEEHENSPLMRRLKAIKAARE